MRRFRRQNDNIHEWYLVWMGQTLQVQNRATRVIGAVPGLAKTPRRRRGRSGN